MAFESESSVRRTTSVCQTCGGNGSAQLLIYCMQCQDCAVHLFCLDKFSLDDDNVTWLCEDCSPKLPKVGPSKKSNRINLCRDRASDFRNNWRKRLTNNGSSAATISACTAGLFKAAQIAGGSLPVEGEKKQFSVDDISGNQECGKQRKRKLEGGDTSKEESEVVKTNVPQLTPSSYDPLNISYSQPAVEPDIHDYEQAKPLIDPIWRGIFSMTIGKEDAFVGLMGYLSSKSCSNSKVCDAANALAAVLKFEILPKRDMWPKSFQKSPPTDHNIALYFFPESERDEKIFDRLLGDIIEQNLALKVLIGAVELLVFSSREMPQQHWRYRRKYYLWGVFREPKSSLSNVPSETLITQSSTEDHVMLTKNVNRLGSKDVQCFYVNAMTCKSPRSPPSSASSHVSNTPHSPFACDTHLEPSTKLKERNSAGHVGNRELNSSLDHFMGEGCRIRNCSSRDDRFQRNQIRWASGKKSCH